KVSHLDEIMDAENLSEEKFISEKIYNQENDVMQSNKYLNENTTEKESTRTKEDNAIVNKEIKKEYIDDDTTYDNYDFKKENLNKDVQDDIVSDDLENHQEHKDIDKENVSNSDGFKKQEERKNTNSQVDNISDNPHVDITQLEKNNEKSEEPPLDVQYDSNHSNVNPPKKTVDDINKKNNSLIEETDPVLKENSEPLKDSELQPNQPLTKNAELHQTKLSLNMVSTSDQSEKTNIPVYSEAQKAAKIRSKDNSGLFAPVHNDQSVSAERFYNMALFIDKQAEYNGELYYRVNRGLDGPRQGWMKASELSAYQYSTPATHRSNYYVRENNRNSYL